ncbi:MAG: hypothetical protein HY205_00785 [Nitrospirae bacterium]|nr:hypothetical protein [Nitrospirota bacterium]
MIRTRRRSFQVMLAGALLLALAGCAVDLQKTQVVSPVEGKLTIYNAIEIPLPHSQNAPNKIVTDLHEKMLLQIGALGKFRRVGTASRADQSVLVMHATILKFDTGSTFMRWMSSLTETVGGVYESYAKQSVGSVSGSMGDGYLLVEVRFVDKRSQKEVGQITIKGLSDDPDNFRSAEDRVVDGLVRYVQTLL